LRDAIQAWADLHNRNVTEVAMEQWMKIFAGTHPLILARALDRVTVNAERMPTPGTLTKEISASSLELAGTLEPVTPCSCMECGGTGFRMADGSAKKCDCHKAHYRGRSVAGHIESSDGEGTPCWFFADEPDVPAYRPQDCKQGRAFLGALANIVGRSPEQAAGLLEGLLAAKMEMP